MQVRRPMLALLLTLTCTVLVAAATATPAAASFAPHGIWASGLGAPPNDERWVDVGKAPDGSLYAAGVYDFEWASTSGDIKVAKYSAADAAPTHLLWSKTWDNPVEHAQDSAAALAVDADGALIVAGSTSTIGFGRQWAVVKWDSSGTKKWEKTFGAFSPLQRLDADAYDVACDAAGDVYVSGWVETGPDNPWGDTGSLCVRKLGGVDGSVIWKRAYHGKSPGYNRGTALGLDAAGNVYVTGSGQNAAHDEDILVCRFAHGEGHKIWVKRIAGGQKRNDEGVDIAVRGSSVWVTGGMYGAGDTRTVALARYTTAGKRLWLRTWQQKSATIEYPRALAVDRNGNAIVAGSGHPNPVTREQAFVLKWNRSGVRQWARLSHGPVTKFAAWNDVACTSAGTIWVGGTSRTSIGGWVFRVGRYSGAGKSIWTSDWAGFDSIGGGCQALCLGQTGLFAGGSYETTAASEDAVVAKYTR